MNILDVMKARHSVRKYLNKPIAESAVEKLEKRIKEINEESGLNFKLILDEPVAFGGLLPKYGSFENANNYIICSGHDQPDFDEKYGYYGEKLVLLAQELGLNTCWVGLTANKKKIKTYLDEGERLGCVISIGYGMDQGHPHKSKDVSKITSVPAPWPEWFKDGMLGAMLAPTAVNQQRFKVSLKDGKVDITSGFGPYTKVDLGIVKCQFEMAAGKDFPGFYK